MRLAVAHALDNPGARPLVGRRFRRDYDSRSTADGGHEPGAAAINAVELVVEVIIPLY